ncbi:MAG: helix-turn-helix transcriptional regulator [Oscillospiraceae bacterium]|nr:helix-turn-helix transcriptional regulator [Oscillospiraceae bacterium]
MELSSQIKKYRTELGLSQEELAEKVYVTRQTVSNWETGKSYPDIHSLLLLGALFDLSLDQLIKGDLETMKEIINEQEVKKFNRYSTILSVLFALAIASAVPLFMWLEVYAFIPFGVLWAVTLFFAFKVDKLKKANNIRTYKEIVAFSEGRKLDEIDKRVEEGKRPYQKVLLIVGVAVVTAIACLLIGLLMNYTLG